MLKTKFSLTLVLLAATASAQWIHYPIPGTPRGKDGKANLTAPVPKAVGGKPDLTGLWTRVQSPRDRDRVDSGIGPDVRSYIQPPNELPSLLPEAAALFQKRNQNLGAGRPSESCLPHSIPDMMLVGRPFKIVQTPTLTMILYEFATRYRQILTDGRPHPADMQPA